MATRKRTRRQTGIVDRAVSAGRRALREAEKRVPPDLRRQVERSLKDADKTARAAIKQLQAQARKASTRADVNSVLKRIDGLTRQARQVAGARARERLRPGVARRARPGALRPARAAPRPPSRKPPPQRDVSPQPAVLRQGGPQSVRHPRRRPLGGRDLRGVARPRGDRRRTRT